MRRTIMCISVWRRAAAFFFLLTLSPNTFSGNVPAKEPLILAVHPYLPVKEIVTRFTPLADYLGNEIGRPVSVRVGSDYQEHIVYVGKDEADIAFMGPAPYVTMLANYGKKPILA